MENWRDIVVEAAVADKRLVLRRKQLTLTGLPHKSGRHELFYVASPAQIGIERPCGKFEYATNLEQLAGCPPTFKFVTKEEKSSHNNLCNNKAEAWELVHPSGVEAVALTPVDNELRGAASWEELADIAGMPAETIAQMRRSRKRDSTRPLTHYFGGAQPGTNPQPIDRVSDGASPVPTSSAINTATARSTTEPAHETSRTETPPIPVANAATTALVTVHAVTEPVTSVQPAATISTAAIARVSDVNAAITQRDMDAISSAPLGDLSVGADLEMIHDRNVIRDLVALSNGAEQSTEGGATGETSLTAATSAQTCLSDRVQALGKIQAEIATLRTSMMNHIIQIGDGVPPVLPVAKPIVCPSLFRVADPALIDDLNGIMFDCAKRCSEALVMAEERALKAMTTDMEGMFRDWTPNDEEREAARAIKLARLDRTHVKAPQERLDKIAFYRLPVEGDRNIPSLNAHRINESGHKIPGKRKPSAKQANREPAVPAREPDTRDPAVKRGPTRGRKTPKKRQAGQVSAAVPKNPGPAGQTPAPKPAPAKKPETQRANPPAAKRTQPVAKTPAPLPPQAPQPEPQRVNEPTAPRTVPTRVQERRPLQNGRRPQRSYADALRSSAPNTGHTRRYRDHAEYAPQPRAETQQGYAQRRAPQRDHVPYHGPPFNHAPFQGPPRAYAPYQGPPRGYETQYGHPRQPYFQHGHRGQHGPYAEGPGGQPSAGNYRRDY